MHDDLTTMWNCVDWENARWFVADSSIEMNEIFSISLVLTGGMHDDWSLIPALK